MHSVLIVDDSTEAREVLRTALERRGLRIFEASRAEQGLALARQHHPDVIVVDLEAAAGNADQVTDDFAATSPAHPASLVLLGMAQRRPAADAGRFIAKPYHYGPLIRRIESLLASA